MFKPIIKSILNNSIVKSILARFGAGSSEETVAQVINRSQNIWSLRKLNPDYTGYCLRLTDGTNNVDIGFLSASGVDYVDSSGNTWIDTFTAYDAINNTLTNGRADVSRWYDQKGGVTVCIKSSASTTASAIVLVLESPESNLPSIKFPGTGQNCFQAVSGTSSLDNFWTSGAAVLINYQALGLGGSSQGRLWSKGTNNNIRLTSEKSLRFQNDRVTTDAVMGIDISAYGGSYNKFQTLIIDWDELSSADASAGSKAFYQLDNGPRVESANTCAGVGLKVSDISSQFTIGNGNNAAQSFNGYISDFIVWKERLI